MGVLATDDFNRADNSTSPNGLGANWTVGKGEGEGFGIASNQASIITASGSNRGSYYNAASAPNDQYSKATIPALSGLIHGVAVRMITTGTSREFYAFGYEANNYNTTSRIWKYVGGSLSSLGTGSTTLASTQTWYLEAQGTSLVAKINGTNEISVTDSSIASGQFGLVGARNGTNNFAVFDDWEGGDFAAAAGQPTMRRWGGTPGMTPGPQSFGRGW